MSQLSKFKCPNCDMHIYVELPLKTGLYRCYECNRHFTINWVNHDTHEIAVFPFDHGNEYERDRLLDSLDRHKKAIYREFLAKQQPPK